jgi:phage shock protein A
MGVLSRLHGVIRANLNSLLDHAEDPDALIAHTVDDMRTELKRARGDLVKTLANARRLEKEADDLDAEGSTWEERAVLALRTGDEGLARDALRQKARCTRQAAATRANADEAARSAEAMKDALERLEKKADELDARRPTLAAELRAARRAPAAAAASGPKFGSAAFDDLERMASRIDRLDAEVEAHAVIDEGPAKAELEARFRDLEKKRTDGDVEDALAALKRKLDS